MTSTIGTTVVLCATKVQEIEREYHVQENVAQAATTTYHAVKNFEEDYKVSERVSQGIQTAVQSAAKAEDDYQITARVNAAYTDSLQYAIEMEARWVVAFPSPGTLNHPVVPPWVTGDW